ncbi:MAG: GNAT family N-acetyltransferase [Paludibacteraceae bacterium]|nr:GNAT family N-acetyltransferase [Paludibacteraceae bacterium]
MAYLCNDELRLRQLEPGDLGFLYRWENDPLLWGVSEFVAPYSQNALKAYIENELKGIFVTGQLRLMIELKESDEVVGTIDLFDFDPMSKRAGVGIFVVPDFQRKGVASINSAVSTSMMIPTTVVRVVTPQRSMTVPPTAAPAMATQAFTTPSTDMAVLAAR